MSNPKDEVFIFLSRNPQIVQFIEDSRITVGDYFGTEAGILLVTVFVEKPAGPIDKTTEAIEFIIKYPKDLGFDLSIGYYKRFYQEYWMDAVKKLGDDHWKIRLGLME